ncbi:MAG: hypothetical protein K6B15_05135 [Parasporobacterium sp.]|nr:hypothetical protein [Parasporobacterium sp.]
MDHCVNCGRRLKAKDDFELKLCKKCCECETLFDAQKAKIQYDLKFSVILSAVIAAIATVIFVFTDFRFSFVGGLVLYIYAAASMGFTAAGCISRYMQLCDRARKEQQ